MKKKKNNNYNYNTTSTNDNNYYNNALKGNKKTINFKYKCFYI